MKNKTLIPDLELSLCPKCASVYYNDRNYYIERTDYTQTIYEECMMCKNPHGILTFGLSQLCDAKNRIIVEVTENE